jgi:hypothetical protein
MTSTPLENCEEPRMRRLIVSTNPWPLFIGVERLLAQGTKDIQTVDGLNALGLIIKLSKYPGWRWRGRIVERVTRKYERFVRPALTGQDITAKLTLSIRPPTMPARIDELRCYRHPETGARLGLAALSSALSITRISFADLTEEVGEPLVDAWRVAHYAHELACKIRGSQYDEIFVFNGRHCYVRPFCEVLSGESKIIRYESGALPGSYIVSDKSLHDPDAIAASIKAHLVNRQAGAEFFRQRSERRPGNDAHKFTSGQQAGFIPEFMSKSRGDTIVLFTSSTDEYLSITEELRYGPFFTQGDIAEELAKISRELGKRFVVRLHPNLRGAHKSWWREWNFDTLERFGAFIVRPEDPTDSYALMRNSAGIVTCGSTIGIEAAYAGIPSISVGRFLGSALGATLEATSIDDLRSFIGQPTHFSNQVEAAILYGSYYMTSGNIIPGFSPGASAEYARIEGKLVDPVCAFYKAISGRR